MTGRCMEIKRMIIPFVTLAIMAGQLAGCAPTNGQETSNGVNELPDRSQQSLDTSQITADDDLEIGFISNQEKQALSEDELLEYFQTVYDIHLEIHTAATPEGIIQEELDFLVSLVDSDGKTLPSDYEARYRAWRPESLTADIQTQSNGQQQGQQNNQQSGGQQQQQSDGQEQIQTQPQGGGSSDLYDGYGSYNAMIDAACKKHPELSREEIMQRIPDPAGIHVDEEAAQAAADRGLLNNGG